MGFEYFVYAKTRLYFRKEDKGLKRQAKIPADMQRFLQSYHNLGCRKQDAEACMMNTWKNRTTCKLLT